MPVLADRTRIQIETAIGYNLGAIFEGSWTAVSSATSNTDTKWKGTADSANGRWLHITHTGSGEDGNIARVTDDNGSGVLTHDALDSTPTIGETYMLWDERYRPDAIHSFINTAVLGLYGRAYNPDENITLFAAPTTRTRISPCSQTAFRPGLISLRVSP